VPALSSSLIDAVPGPVSLPDPAPASCLAAVPHPRRPRGRQPGSIMSDRDGRLRQWAVISVASMSRTSHPFRSSRRYQATGTRPAALRSASTRARGPCPAPSRSCPACGIGQARHHRQIALTLYTDLGRTSQPQRRLKIRWSRRRDTGDHHAYGHASPVTPAHRYRPTFGTAQDADQQRPDRHPDCPRRDDGAHDA
jgi:hypothetical protein